MIYLSYILAFFLLLRLLISLINLLSFRYLPRNSKNSTLSNKVSVLIPTRNEEKNIGFLLEQLCKSSYLPSEIIVCNDNSSDNTVAIVEKYAKQNSNIRLIEGATLPNDWLGKNYACHQLAKQAKADFYLFLDADVRIESDLIFRSLLQMKKYKLELLSIFPKQIFGSFGEKITVPLMNWILLSFLPLLLVRTSKNPAFSAANGQFMLFKADTYQQILPHKVFKKHKVEDIAIIKYFKEQKLKVDTLLGDRSISCRMYNSGAEAINGFTKNIFQFFGGSIGVTVLVGLVTSCTPIVLFLFLGVWEAYCAITSIVLIRIFVSIASNQSVIANIVYLLPQHLSFIYIIYKGMVNQKKKELIWKGRNIL